MRLIDCLATTDALSEIFSDDGVLQAMLDFEAALARAEAAAGVIPAAAAQAISTASRARDFNPALLADAARRAATPSIPLVTALADRVRLSDPSSAEFVHWGATSQDVTDTALVLLLKRASPAIRGDHDRLAQALRRLSDTHANTIMLGRTLLQPAVPITFGLKAAGWYAAATRGWKRLGRAWQDALVVQFGGAAGTLASLGDRAGDVAVRVAAELQLRPAPPWHADRDRVGAVVTGCGLYVATLGKIARDLSLLMQAEVGEAVEHGGGSSSMPQKQNPSGCAVVLAAATRMPGLVAAYLNGMLQEHERSVGGSQAEWPTIASVVQGTGAAAAALADVLDGLTVHPERMRENVSRTSGSVFAERAVLALAPRLGKEAAHTVVAEALRSSRSLGISLVAALQRMPDVGRALEPDALGALDRAELYLGAAEAFRRDLLAEPKE